MPKQIALPSTEQPVQVLTNEYIDKALSKFKNMDELVVDPKFRQELTKVLNEVQNRPAAPAGKRYKRGAWEYLSENGLFNTDRFLNVYHQIDKRIGEKKPMDVRELVGRIIKDASTRAIVYYAQQEMSPEPTQKKSRKKVKVVS